MSGPGRHDYISVTRAAVIAALAAMLGLMAVAALAGCAARRQRATEASGRTEASARTAVETVTAGREELLTAGWLTATCEELTLTLTADSAVTPAGTVVYRPTLKAKAVRPALKAEKTEAERTETAAAQRVEKTDSVATTAQSVTRSETAAETAAPWRFLWPMALFAAGVIAVGAWLRKKQK